MPVARSGSVAASSTAGCSSSTSSSSRGGSITSSPTGAASAPAWRARSGVPAERILLALAAPLDGLAHERFSAHMLQHLLLLTVAAPLGLLANPFPVVIWTLPGRARIALRPLLARGGVLRGGLRALTGMPLAWVLFAVT